MASKRIVFPYLVLLYWLCFDLAYSTVQEPSSIVIPNEWELVKPGWPLQDVEDTKNNRTTQFHYVKDKNQNLIWKIKSSFLQQLKEDSQIYKLSFKYWSHYEVLKPQSAIMIGNYVQKVSDRYFPDFEGYWMPCEYFMSYQNLTLFQIFINTGDEHTIVAFKDFKIEYETQTQNQKTYYEVNEEYLADTLKKQADGISLIGWNKYSPPGVISENESQDFLYFSSNCYNGCLIKAEGINFSDSDKVTKIGLSFKYWIKGDSKTKIEFYNKRPELNSSSRWELFHDDDMKEQNYKSVWLNITTMETKLNEESFVAIKDLKINISYKSSDKIEAKSFVCNTSACDWKFEGSFQWHRQIEHLEQNTIYYYPNSSMNSLETTLNDDLSDLDVCFSIKYWVAFDKDVNININLNMKNEKTKDTILTIRPKTNKNTQRFESTHFCLRDLVALSAKGYVISFTVKHFDYKDGINGFALSFENYTNKVIWDFDNNTQTFLQPMKLPFEDENGKISGQWSKDWIQLSPQTPGLFEFKQEYIEFTATTETKTPALAQLISKWIKYDPNLHLIDPQYSIRVLDSKLFESFKIRPKVCDWLSHCMDVIQRVENDDQNSRVFSFKFRPLNNSEYIRLSFYVEYFQPSYFNKGEIEIKFDLKLLHFGDPCLNAPKCKNNGICVSDFKKDIPNKPSCSCTQSWTGQTCEQPNYCGTINNYTKINKTMSGSRMCNERRPDLECENLESDFRCICGVNKDKNIYWDNENFECVDPLEHPEKIRWFNSSGIYYAYDSVNSLNFTFKNINTTKYDVCMKMDYNSNQIIQLNVGYNYRSKSSNLFSVSLSKPKDHIEFCVRDFRYIVRENFQLSLQVSGAHKEIYNENTFRLTGISSYLKPIINTSIPYIYNWDRLEQTKTVNPGFNQNWISFPNGLFASSNGNLTQTFTVNISSNMSSKALLISDWITNSQNFNSSVNYYSIQYAKGSIDKYFRLDVKIIYQENDEIRQYINQKNANTREDNNYTISESRISIPTSINTPFKLIFEITYFLPVNEKNATSLDITFKNISVGDPCFKDVCMNNGKCHGLGPNNYVCQCTNDSFGGNNCELPNICKIINEQKITNEELCKYSPSLPTSKENKCILLPDKSFECRCPQKDFVWSKSFQRCVRNGYNKVVESCEGKNCEILDSSSDIKWSNKNIPQVTSLRDENLPFYFSPKSDAKLQIQVNNLDNQYDACFNFSYEISNTSNLLISYNNLKPIAFNPNKPLNWYPEGNGEEICARSLAKDIDKNFNITLVSTMLNLEKDMIALRFIQDKKSVYNSVYFTQRVSNLLPELPYLIHWSTADKDGNYTFENQWPLALPGYQWKNSPYDSIIFKASGILGQQASYLFSNWLRKDVDGYKLRFNITETNFANFTIQIVVYDTQMQPKPISDFIIGDKSLNSNAQNYTNKTVLVPISKMSTSFRVALKVNYQLMDLSSEVSFTLQNIDLGDPCVMDNATYNLCINGGECIRNGPVNSYKCRCKDGYEDKNCQTIDYCNYKHDIGGKSSITGKEFCQQGTYGECINGGYGGFSCSCNNETFWNFNQLACQVNLKCIAKQCDFKTEKCEEPKDPKGDAKCVCKDNYVDVSNSSSIKCEKFDPCNDHGNRSNLAVIKPCGTSNARCIPLGDRDYTCVCKEGYQNTGDKENSNCIPLFCEFPTLNTCKQTCEHNNTIARSYNCSCTEYYDIDGDSCKLKSGKTCNCKGEAFCDGGPDDCKCKRGYKTITDKDGKNNGCEPDMHFSVGLAICPNGKTNVTNNKLVCECGSAYKLNDKNTCDLRPICGKGAYGREVCDSKNALCIIDQNDVGGFSCPCPLGKELNNNTCVDYCANNTRLDYCQKRNAECDQTQDNTIDNHKRLCFCRPGFIWSDKRGKPECVIGKYTVEFKLSIKNTFYEPINQLAQIPESLIPSKFSADLNGFYDDLKSTREENDKLVQKMRTRLEPIKFEKELVHILSTIIGMTSFSSDNANETIVMEKCEIDSDFYNCLFTMSLKRPIKEYESSGNLSQQLSKLCISYPGESRNCFFPKPKNDNYYDSSPSALYSLVIDKGVLAKTSVSKFKPCEALKNKNICSGYTKCVDEEDPNLSLYSCVCNSKYFSNYSMEYLPIMDSDPDSRAVKHECKVRDDLCSDCPPRNEHGKCVQSSPYKDSNNEWVAPRYCECDDQFILSNNSRSCIGVCKDINCNHGKCAPRGSTGYACECNEGWNGKNCDSEYTVKNTIWIIVIAILGVLVVIAAIVAVFFAIKARNSEDDGNGPNQQMTEYSGTSYRVERSRPAVVRTQSSNRGQENLTFHRD